MENSKYKLVYTNWLTLPYGRIPIANGNHPKVYDWMQKYADEHPEKMQADGEYQRIYAFESNFQMPSSGVVFRHVSIFSVFNMFYGRQSLVSLDDIDPNDDCVYFLPYEVEGQSMNYFYGDFQFNIDGENTSYRITDTIKGKLLEYVNSGKVKILIGSLSEPTYGHDTILNLDREFTSKGINPSSVNLLFGNCSTRYKGQIRQFTSHESLRQQAEIGLRYPINASSLGYYCDYPRENELDSNIIRPKKFICWNRTMNRAHRATMLYMALKHDLLKDGIFSFLHGLVDYFPSQIQDLVDDPIEDIKTLSQTMKDMLPYEVDTQTLNEEGKQGFQTNENNKKEFYADTYLHITSETCFDSHGTPFMSEKTFRPILNLQPFIYIGNHHGLEELRRLGFKTFDGYIDESYDLETDPKKRWAMIEKEILRFSNMTIEELHNWYYSLTDILIHNQRHFLSLYRFNPLQELCEAY